MNRFRQLTKQYKHFVFYNFGPETQLYNSDNKFKKIIEEIQNNNETKNSIFMNSFSTLNTRTEFHEILSKNKINIPIQNVNYLNRCIQDHI